MTEDNKDQPIDELYPKHAAALKAANNAPDSFPTLSEAIDSAQARKKRRKKKKKRRNGQVYFCIGWSRLWRYPIHAIIKRLKLRYRLNWLRVSMSEHVFSNIRGLLQRDLQRKMMAGVRSLDYVPRACNCSQKRLDKSTRFCVFGGKCRRSMVVYQFRIKETNEVYIGSTQNYLKKRFSGHCQSVRNLWVKTKHPPRSLNRLSSFSASNGNGMRKLGKNC